LKFNRRIAQGARAKGKAHFFGSLELIDDAKPFGIPGIKSLSLCSRASQGCHQKDRNYRESLPFHSRKHESILFPEILSPVAFRSNAFSDLRKGQQSSYQRECSATGEQDYGKYKKIEHVSLALIG
tara:strand:- start:13602 stop:13979 length:378 start_codon:yes stop_codon:yes gene_type:complete